MKLSTVLIGSMLLAASATQAQTKGPLKPVKKDTVRYVKHINEIGKPDIKTITIPDTLKPVKADTIKIEHLEITPDYCPPCGMG